MIGFYYRLSNVDDPEERLEDACMAKAMHDHYGHGITILGPSSEAPASGVTFGRTRRFQSSGVDMKFAAPAAYWDDPGFRHSIKREFVACDYEGAKEMVARLHEKGKDAFVKAREQKLMVASIPRGRDFDDVIGDMVYSFIDNPGSLLVQEHVEMHNERRFVVIDSKIVTCSPVQVSLTPMSRAIVFEDNRENVENIHFRTPTTGVFHVNHTLAKAMRAHAEEIIRHSNVKNMILDLATVGDRIEAIEYNPMLPGMFGLFACRPDRIAEASEALLPADLLAEVHDRRARKDPFPAPEAREPDPDTNAPWTDDIFSDGP